MNEHREAIERSKIEHRKVNAVTEQEKRLSEVESAVLASKKELDAESRELSQNVAADRITQTVAQERMASRRAQHLKLIDKMKEDIVDPIATEVEAQARKIETPIPERTSIHIEASEHYRSLDSDGRQDLISKAVTGQDDTLAVALLTGRDPITDVTREQLAQGLKPTGQKNDEAKIMQLATRVQATLSTIEGARQ